MKNNKEVRQATRLAVFLGLLFVVCFIGYYVRGTQEVHREFLSLMFWGFTGMNVESFVSGLAQSVIDGYVGYGLWRLTSVAVK